MTIIIIIILVNFVISIRVPYSRDTMYGLYIYINIYRPTCIIICAEAETIGYNCFIVYTVPKRFFCCTLMHRQSMICFHYVKFFYCMLFDVTENPTRVRQFTEDFTGYSKKWLSANMYDFACSISPYNVMLCGLLS